VTQNGGERNNNCSDSGGCGVVFELTPNSDGTWTETVLHSFTGAQGDGDNPFGGLTFDSAGNLYGTTTSTAGTLAGLVFELSPVSGGAWNETVLYAFTGGQDGDEPGGGLVFDTAGNLYGVTRSGGSQNSFCSDFNGCGVVFELTPNQDGSWQEVVLHTFTAGADGAFPFSGLTIDSSGNLFGTTANGGNSNCPLGCGVAFELTQGSGSWTESVLYSFSGGPSGEDPFGGLTISPRRGNIYGTTTSGGANGKAGVVFELIPTRTGSWEEKALPFGGKFGGQPTAGVTLGASGQVYGVTSAGGVGRGGVVFEITK
jgi:hypothetical protein